MKKLLLILLTLLIAVSLCACSENKDDQSENTSATTTETTTTETTTTETTTTETTTAETTTEQVKPVTREYQTYDNGALSFSYPKSWSLTEGAVDMMMDALSGNNITVTSEPKSDYYATMNTETFCAEIQPTLESMGMAISNVSVEHTKNANGVEMTVIAYTANYAGMEMKQTQYITNVGNLSYSVTMTEMVDDAALVQTVFDTLTVDESDQPSGNTEYQTYKNQAIVFNYPNTMADMSEDGMGLLYAANGNNITVAAEAKNDYYATMDVKAFNETMKPVFESMGMVISEVSVEQIKNVNALALTKIVFTNQYMNTTMKQTLFITTVGNETYTVTVTEAVADASLVEMVFTTLDVVS